MVKGIIVKHKNTRHKNTKLQNIFSQLYIVLYYQESLTDLVNGQ